MAQPTRTRITADEYFNLPEHEKHDLIQLIDGQIVFGSAETIKHQQVLGKILFRFTTYARENGGHAYMLPTETYFDEYNVFEPDVLYISPKNKDCELTKKRIIGAPDLVVEILSPSTAKYDKQAKYLAYEANGVQEYWIVDPTHDTIEVWTLVDDNFKRTGAFSTVDVFKSSVLSKDVNVGEILET